VRSPDLPRRHTVESRGLVGGRAVDTAQSASALTLPIDGTDAVQSASPEEAEPFIRNAPGNFRFTAWQARRQPCEQEILEGLSRTPKTISPKYLYDARGSWLFERICRLPEYYPARAETAILKTHGESLLGTSRGRPCLIELGAGDCKKGRLLLSTGLVANFVPVDISRSHLARAALKVAIDFPQVRIHAVGADFAQGFSRLPALLPAEHRRVVLYAGSSIGNFDPPEARAMLTQMRDLAGDDGTVLVGYDLRKDPEILRRAYDDVQGVTAAFNLNLLARLNREARAGFDLSTFRHVALYNHRLGRIEMHLESALRQDVPLGDTDIHFYEGERIHTESSYKHEQPEFDTLAASAGLRRAGFWTDPAGRVALASYTCSEALHHAWIERH
jgi:L-histidine N-alpha-methyltransferase